MSEQEEFLPEVRTLTSAQQQVLLDEVRKCLSSMVAAEMLMQQKDLTDTEVFSILKTRRERLTRIVQDALRATQTAPAAPAAGSRAHQALTPFASTMGPVLRAVTEGPDVVNLQELLNLEGFQVPVNGKYDRRTIVAVRKLQLKYGIKPDGVVGGKTRHLLNRLTGHGS